MQHVARLFQECPNPPVLTFKDLQIYMEVPDVGLRLKNIVSGYVVIIKPPPLRIRLWLRSLEICRVVS